MTAKTQEITITQAILASPSQVYAAFTTAEGWCAWCCEQAKADAQVGGKLHIYTDGYNAYGEYKVLESNKSVTFTWDGDKEPPTLIQVSLDEQDTQTRMIFQVTVLGSEQDYPGFAEFLERIWGRALNNLKTVLETKPAR